MTVGYIQIAGEKYKKYEPFKPEERCSDAQVQRDLHARRVIASVPLFASPHQQKKICMQVSAALRASEQEKRGKRETENERKRES